MPNRFHRILTELRNEERHLAAQLAKIKIAISSLEFGGGGVPAPAVIETPHAVKVPARARRRRKMSAAARQAVSVRMKKYWAAKRNAKK